MNRRLLWLLFHSYCFKICSANKYQYSLYVSDVLINNHVRFIIVHIFKFNFLCAFQVRVHWFYNLCAHTYVYSLEDTFDVSSVREQTGESVSDPVKK